MTQPILQPYHRLEPQHISQLAYNGSLVWISQSYRRGQLELDHSKTAILFTPYKDRLEANQHFNKLQKDTLAAIVNIDRKDHLARVMNLCNGITRFVPFISLTFNLPFIQTFIFRHYRDKYRLWVRKNKPDWIIREHNAVDAHFQTMMGEPMLKLTYGKQFVMVRLEELEKM